MLPLGRRNPTSQSKRRRTHDRSARHLLRISDKSRNGALLLVVPLAIQLVLFKLIKFAILSGAAEKARAVPQENLIGHLLVQHASVPTLIIAFSVFLLVLIVTQLSLSGPGATALALGLWAIISAAVARLLPGDHVWLDARFFAAVRWDLITVLVMAAVALMTLEHLRGALRAMSVTALHVAALVMMLLASLDFGYFVLTGSLADSFMLQYAFTNASNLRYVLLHELSGTKLILMLLPFLCATASFIYCIGPRRPSPRSSVPVVMLALASLCLLILPVETKSDQTSMLSGSTFGELIAKVADRGDDASLAIPNLTEAVAPLFDTSELEFLPGEEDLPNIVVIVLESQRHSDHLKRGLLFNPTPFLDKLMQRSLVVDEMYAVVPHTNKALVPILCGVYPKISQGDESHVPGRCLPRLLQDAGYRSAFFTPATLEFERKADLLKSMGFDDMFGDGNYDVKGFERVNYFGHEERIMLRKSMQWVDANVRARQPFMATYLTTTPHHPYKTASHFPVRSFGDERPDFNKYLNAIAYVDDFLERLFGEFEARRLLESTVFVIVGDHGEAFGEHGLRFHSAVPYEEVLKVPAVVYAPGRVGMERVTVTGPRQQIDLLPTMVDLTGGLLEGGFLPGVSLLNPVPGNRRLYHAGWIENQSMALRDGPIKFVYHFGRKPTEMFDLRDDPYELSPTEIEHDSKEAHKIAEDLHLWRARVNAAYRN